MKTRITIVLALMLGALFPVAVSAAPVKVANFSLRDGSQSEKLATFSSPRSAAPAHRAQSTNWPAMSIATAT